MEEDPAETVPSPLGDGTALAALRRVGDAIRPTQGITVGPRLFASDGRYETYHCGLPYSIRPIWPRWAEPATVRRNATTGRPGGEGGQMRLANVAGRLAVVTGTGVVDVATASGGRFGPDPQDVYPAWADFAAWTGAADWNGGTPLDESALGPVVPRPRQVFAVGLNYVDHAAESGLRRPDQPMIFTKFPSCLTGPVGDIALPSDSVDWEVELVVAIGATASAVAPQDAWRYVAGLTIGQDLSDRDLQMKGAPPQFSLAKSYPGFGPVGPYLTTLDEVPNPDDIALRCTVNGETVQDGHSRDMVFPVPVLISYLSGICTLHPGDLIFTGTPAGVGIGRTPPRYLRPGDMLETRISGLGTMRHRLVAA